MLLLFAFLFAAVASQSPEEFNQLSNNDQNLTSIASNGGGGGSGGNANGKNCYDSSLCLTKGCLRAAVRMFDSIDESIDPCDDFYNFACGKWKEDTPLPDDKTDIDIFSMTRDLVNFQLKKALSKPGEGDEPRAFQLARDFYASCVNVSKIEERGNEPLKNILQMYGGWPVIEGDSWSEGSFDWMDTMRRFRMMGLDHSIIITVDVLPDAVESDKRIIVIDQPSFGLEQEFLVKGFEEKTVQSYLNFLIENAVLLGAQRERAEQELREVVEFEIKLAKISLSSAKRRKASTIKMKLRDVQLVFPYINWVNYINSLLPNGLSVDENEIVSDYVPTFFKRLGAVLGSTSTRTIANYCMWRIVLAQGGNSAEDMRDIKLDYYKDVYGLMNKVDRSKECVSYTVENMEVATSAMYARKYFTLEKKEAAIEMVENIRAQFVDNLIHNVPWMMLDTRNRAIEKALSIQKHIAYPEELFDNAQVDDYYKELEISDSLLMNSIQVKKFLTDKKLRPLREPIDKTDWRTHAKSATVGGYYSRVENSIQLTAGILQDRFFDLERPMYINYGAIGQVIGHEITHGFDDKGRLYNLNGDLRKWWDDETIANFKQRSQCFVEEYGNFTEPQTGLMLNGKNTLGENIADNGGLKNSYYAYLKWAEQNGPEDRLPQLDWNPKQLFWISSAQLWCSVETDSFLKNRVESGMHSPNQFRVNGVLMNLYEFSTDFQCPAELNMYPKRPCEMW